MFLHAARAERRGRVRLLRQSLPDPMYAADTWCPWPRGDTSDYAPGFLVLPELAENFPWSERRECDELDTASVTAANDTARLAS